MSRITPRRSALVTSTIVAISAVGLLAGPWTARAAPPLPSAPVCSYDGPFAVNQSNGFRVEVDVDGTSISGSGVAFGSNSKAFVGGPATGSIEGDKMNFTIDWDGPSKGKYTGTVDSNGIVSGTTTDVGLPGPTATWKSIFRLECVAAPAPQSPLPAKTAPKPVPTPKAPTATVVTSDVDVYDKPGGDGTVVDILRLGTVVKVLKPCPADDWCALADGRYVFGEFLENN